jgi:DNA-directed RNA polymerase subunit H (RpoH/RPB5)
MPVKSATKKRLIELGVEEAAAHKLATDRNMADIKKMSPDEVAAELNVSKDSQVHQDVMRIIADQGSRRRAAKKSRKLTIRARAIDEYDRPELSIRFNPLNHVMVPHQELVGAANISEDEQYHVEAEELAPWQLEVMDEETGVTRLAKELLPKVLITDPAVQVIKEAAEAEDMAMLAADPDHRPLAAGWIADRVLKVVRRSPTAGTAVAYRLIVEGS